MFAVLLLVGFLAHAEEVRRKFVSRCRTSHDAVTVCVVELRYLVVGVDHLVALLEYVLAFGLEVGDLLVASLSKRFQFLVDLCSVVGNLLFQFRDLD